MKKTTKKPTTRTLTAPQKSVVRSLINRGSETHFVVQDSIVPDGSNPLTNFVAFSSGITAVSEIYAAIPQVAQGEDSHQRAGNMLSPRKIYTDLNIVVKNGPSDAFSTDKIVHVFLLTSKAVKDLNNYTAIPIGQMLDYGNGTSGGFDGSSGASMYPVQTKSFRVLKHWKKRMTNGYGHPIGSTGTQAGTTDSVISVSPNSYASIRLNVKSFPEQLKYATKSSTYPENFAPFFVIGWTRADSAGNSAPSFINTYVQGKTSMYFKDS